MAGSFDKFLRKFIEFFLSVTNFLGLASAALDPNSGSSYYWATATRALGVVLAVLVIYSNIPKRGGEGGRSLMLLTILPSLPFSRMMQPSGTGYGFHSRREMRLLEISSFLNFLLLIGFFAVTRDPLVIGVLATLPLFAEVPAAVVALRTPPMTTGAVAT